MIILRIVFDQTFIIYIYMDPQYNPRATVVESRTEDEQKIDELLTFFEKSQNLVLSDILSELIATPAIKEEPGFMQILFEKNIGIVEEMFWWMLCPSHIIQTQTISKSEVYPYLCKQFMKDNWCFYEQLYLSCINEKISISFLLNFLHEQYMNSQTLPTALGHFEEVMTPFAKYQFSGSFQIVQTLQKQGKSYGVMVILPENTISEIISYSHYPAIYKFLDTAILVSLDDENDRELAMQTLEKLFNHLKSLTFLPKTEEELTIKYLRSVERTSDFLQKLSCTLKQTLQNVDGNNISPRSESYLLVLAESNLTQYLVDMIVESQFCKNPQHQKNSNYTEIEEDILEFSLNILKEILQIYKKIILQQKISEKFQYQIQYLFDQLPNFTKLVLHPQSKLIPLSSGQNIKPITFMKYAFFKLLLSCLQLSQNYGQKFILNFDKIPIFSIIERYLIENRWNNLVHHTLQKISQIVFTTNLNLLQSKSKNITDGFLGMLIENFTNKNYIFLNTFNFTNQGHLHSLYIIAKKLAYELKNSNQLVVMIHESQPWKRFIMNDLKKYEDRTYGPITKPIEYEERRSNQSFQCLQVDEFDSIKKLIDNISKTKKWPVKSSYKKKNSLSGIFRKSGDFYTYSSGQSLNYSTGNGGKKLEELLAKKPMKVNGHKDESFEIDEFELVITEQGPEKEKSKMVKSDILKRCNSEDPLKN